MKTVATWVFSGGKFGQSWLQGWMVLVAGLLVVGFVLNLVL